MSNSKHGRRFIFHGNATPFGARIVSIGGKPHLDFIEGPPSASLSVVGGLQRGENKEPRTLSPEGVFAWGPTLAESKGEVRADGHHITTVTSSIADVSATNDPHVFKAARLSITMVSDHPPAGEPGIVPNEMIVEGLELDGDPIELVMDDDLKTYPTFAAFERQYRKNQDFFEKYQVGRGSGVGTFGERFPRTEDGYVMLTVVRTIVFRKKRIKGNVLALKGFGKIHFGEVLMKSNRRRVTLVRLAMGSNTSSTASCACADNNGSWGH